MTHALRTPSPTTGGWRSRAACQDLGCEVFFHPQGERGISRSARESVAKRICRRCPVIVECLEHALAAREVYGVWGGLSEAERRHRRRLSASGPRDPSLEEHA